MRRSYYALFALLVFVGIFFVWDKVSSAPLANNLAWCTANSGSLNISHSECQSLAYLYEETDGDNWRASD